MISGIEGKYVYISGPMTGVEDWNRRAFARAERACLSAGAAYVFNPAADAPAGDDGTPHSRWMLRDVHELTTRRADGGPFYDLVLQLPGWKGSRGASFEALVASVCGIETKEVI